MGWWSFGDFSWDETPGNALFFDVFLRILFALRHILKLSQPALKHGARHRIHGHGQITADDRDIHVSRHGPGNLDVSADVTIMNEAQRRIGWGGKVCRG